MAALRAFISAAILSLTLSGCVSLSDFFASFGIGKPQSEAVVGLPQYKVGDAFTFGAPNVTWRVVSVDDQRVTWRSDKGDEQVTGRNPLLPALAWRSERIGDGQRIISDKEGSLFPLKIGARTTFRAAVTTDKPPYGWGFNWQCEVLDRQDIAGPNGPVDAFKVGCGREALDEIVFFYAPSIGHYVAKSSSATGSDTTRVKHLVAYERINAEGVLERVAFAGHMRIRDIGTPVQTSIAETGKSGPKPVLSVPVKKDDAAEKVAAGGLEAKAQQLLAQRKSITRRVARAATSAKTELPRAEVVSDIAPSSGASSGSSASDAQVAQTGGFKLVTPELPPFPPRPKLNPVRATTQLADAGVPKVMVPVLPQTVAEVPALTARTSGNPFEVSIVKKAHAAPDRSGDVIRKAREKALRAPGMGDEAMLAVKSSVRAERATTAKAEPAAQPAQARKADVRGRQTAALTGRLSTQEGQTATAERFYGAHLGTFLDPQKALRGWRHIYRSHRDVLSGLQPRIRRHDLGEKGVRYRLRVVPFVDASAAGALCTTLTKRGKFCRVTVE